MPASQEDLTAASHRLADSLRCIRGPSLTPGVGGELLYLGEKIPIIAWHLARTGADVHPERAVIKAHALPERIGQMAGMVMWVPHDYTAPEPAGAQPVSALAPDVDLDAMNQRIPWHTHTRIGGDFR